MSRAHPLPITVDLTLYSDSVLSPLCSYETHCGYRAVLGPPEPYIDPDPGPIQCSSRHIVCLRCGATGTESRSLTPARSQAMKGRRRARSFMGGE